MQVVSLEVVDYFVLGFILLSGIVGFVRGFVLEFLGICVWILPFFGAKLLFPHIEPFLAEYISSKMLLNASSWLFAYSCAFLLLIITKYLATLTIKGSNLSGLDRIMGFPIGMVRGFIIIVVMLFVFNLFSANEVPDCISRSRSYPVLNKVVLSIDNYLGLSTEPLREVVSTVKAKVVNTTDGWSEELDQTEKQVEIFSNPIPKRDNSGE